MKLNFSPQKICRILITIVIFLTVVSIAGQIYKYFIGHDRYLVTLVNLDSEWNIPTWYASNSLLFCSFLLAIISFANRKTGNRYYLHWRLLSFIFLCLAMDEAIQFHEQTIKPLRILLGTKGIFYFAWVIPAAILLLIFVIFFMKFLLNLPVRIRFLFIVAGTIYVTGAVGMELVSGSYMYSIGQENFTYAMLTNLEEVLEMIGILIFIYTLLTYIGSNIGELKFSIEDKNIKPTTNVVLKSDHSIIVKMKN